MEFLSVCFAWLIRIKLYFIGFAKFFYNSKVLCWTFSITGLEILLTNAGFNGPLLLCMIGLVIADTVSGIYVAHRKHELSSNGFAKLFDKIFVYAGLIYLNWHLQRVVAPQFPNVLWSDELLYTAFIIRDSISFVEKLGKLNSKLIPGFILKRLKLFDSENGKFIEQTNE
jgi:phage-related holin